MYQIIYQLPDSKHVKSKLLKMDEQQEELSENLPTLRKLALQIISSQKDKGGV
jgi:hypothetical protein